MPRLTASLGLKRGGLGAAEVSPPGLPWTCPPAPPVQGQPWSPVPPCGGAGNRLPQHHLGTPSPSGPAPLADSHPPSLLALPTHFLSLFTFSAFSFLLCPQCVHIRTHTFITSAHVCGPVVTTRVYAGTRARLCILVIFATHVLSRPLSAQPC